MKKILLSTILILATVLNFTCAFAYEYAPYIGDGIIKSTSVILTDSEGNEVDSLTGGENIEASVRVSVGSGSLTGSEKVSLILASYSNGFFEDLDIVTATVSSSQTLSTLSTDKTISVPSNNPGIRVFLWDEVDGSINARPLFSMGEFSAEASGITQISVGGKLIEDFSPDKYEYDVTVNAGYISWPEVIAFTGNAMTKVTADYEGVFPLSTPDKQIVSAEEKAQGTSKIAVATIKAGNKTYKINVTQEVPQITDVTLAYVNKETSTEEVWPAVKNIKVYMSCAIDNPKWNEDYPGPNIESGTGMTSERMSAYSVFFNDSAVSGACPLYAGGNLHFLYNLSPELIGAQQIAIQRTTTNAGPVISAETDDYLSFTIERSARIFAYVGSDAAALKSTDGWLNVTNEIYSSSEKAVRGVYARYVGTSATAYSQNLINPMKYLDVNVKPGEKVTVKIPKGVSIGYTFIKYCEESDIVSNVSYKYGKTSASTKIMSLYKPLLADSTLTGTDLYKKYKASAGESSALKEDTVADGTGNVLFGSSVFGNAAAHIPVSYDDRFENARVIRLRNKLPDLEYVKFDLSAPAKVYVLTNITNTDDFEQLKGCLKGWKIMGEGEDKLITFYNGANGEECTYTLAEKTSFEKTYCMDYGETTTVNLDFSGMEFPDGKILMVLIQPLN